MADLELWYEAPAREWTEALPVGNGRLGAMVFGGVSRERLQLNEETLWTGGPYSQVNSDARAHLQEVRDLIFAGRYAAAEALADRHLMGHPLKQMSYQAAGDLWIEQTLPGEAVGYRRSLDLDTAIATTRFSAGGASFARETFASAPDQVVAVRLRADRPGAISFTLSLTSEQPGKAEPATTDGVGWRGRNRDAEGVTGRLTFAVRAEVRTVGGTVTPDGALLKVEGADEAILIIDAATSFRRYDDTGGDPAALIAARFAAVAGKSFDELRRAQIAEHQRLFRRLDIDLGHGAAAGLPTDRRIAANPQQPDASLAALYVQFGRYLMIAASRPGTQPATLQGIWNDRIDPPWGSKYTTNINLQMNYWLPDPANLSECMEPLIRLVEDVSVTGSEMAAAHYDARGWVLHHNTDIWRAVGPTDGARWGLWPTGGAWLCAQLWDHAVFLGRPEPLVRRLYPLIAGAARFILDVLVPLPGTDLLVTSPSLSPENAHPHGASLCAGPAMDCQIVRDLFDVLIAAADQLDFHDDELIEEARRARRRIPPDRIGRARQLQEWLDDWDMEAPEIRHRHVSHLHGLYPSRQIDPDFTPDLAAAARRSLEIRGDRSTGWGTAWRINLWARLRDGDHAHEVLMVLLSSERTYPNMFDGHPPFQIDGNFGGAAGVLEMLVQSGDDWIRLLPALPSAWGKGFVQGVRARGGLEVNMNWAEGRLLAAQIRSDTTRTVRILHGSSVVVARLHAGTAWMFPGGGLPKPSIPTSSPAT